jgi:hypothetical protein
MAYDRNKAAYDAFVSGSGKYDNEGVYVPGGINLLKMNMKLYEKGIKMLCIPLNKTCLNLKPFLVS